MGDMTITDTGYVPETGADVETGYEASNYDETPTEVPSESTPVEPPEGALFEYDGQWITADEARNGYLRQADYTRKTQELAENRKQLEQFQTLQSMLETNPERTLQVLAASYGVQLTPAQAAALADTDPYGYEPDIEVDPIQAELAELRSFKEQYQQDRVVADVQREIDAALAKFGEFDVMRVLDHAARGNFPSIEAAYKDLAFEDLQAAQAAAAKKAQAEAEATDAKRAAQVAHTGGSRSEVAPGANDEKPQNVREAWAYAKKQLGIE